MAALEQFHFLVAQRNLAGRTDLGLTSRKRRPLDRTEANRDATLIIIATEGEITEPEYFKRFHSTRIQIKILKTENGMSAPDKVLERLSEFKQQFELKEEDKLFLVIDKDRWPEKALSGVAKSCVEQGFGLAVSNPCFEAWLALHFFNPQEVKPTAKEILEQLKTHLSGYNKSIKDEWINEELVNLASARAKELDTNPADRWPQSLGSRVYQVVDLIFSRK